MVQVTLVGVAVVLALLAFDGWAKRGELADGSSLTSASPASVVEVIALGTGSMLSLAAALAMGIRLPRGPNPPDIH